MDFHCHLDLYPDARQVYAQALTRNEFTWLVTTSPRAFAATSKVLPATSRLVISPGLHPEVADSKAGELDMLLGQVRESHVVGEVGLDGSPRYRAHFGLQQAIFGSMLYECQLVGGRVLSVHSRFAANEVLEAFANRPGFGTAVMHWFSGSPSEMARATDIGCWFSVGPAMLESPNGRRLAQMMPRDRVVPESDGPFATVGSKTVMPWDALSTATVLARLWALPEEDAREALISNGRQLSKLLRPVD